MDVIIISSDHHVLKDHLLTLGEQKAVNYCQALGIDDETDLEEVKVGASGFRHFN